MGLDQYVMQRIDSMTLDESGESTKEILYYRKRPEIQDFFEKKWREVEENDGDFNCVDYDLTPEVVVELLQKINASELDYSATGFFWGRAVGTTEEEFTELQREYIKDWLNILSLLLSGEKLYYTSWW